MGVLVFNINKMRIIYKHRIVKSTSIFFSVLYAIKYIESLLSPFRAPTALKELLMNRPRFANFAVG